MIANERELECQRCGACCRQAGNIVKQMPELEAAFKPFADGSCSHLVSTGDGKFGCNIYSVRPDICRVIRVAEYFRVTTGRSIDSHFEAAAQCCEELREKERMARHEVV